MSNTANKIAENAIEMVGTPFKAQGRLKGVALDCLGLILCSAKEAGVEINEGNPRYKVIGKNMEYGNNFIHLVREINTKNIEKGDVLIFEVDRGSSIHMAIYVGDNQIVHSSNVLGSVVMQSINDINWPIIKQYRWLE